MNRTQFRELRDMEYGRRRNAGSSSIKYSRLFRVISSGDKKKRGRSNPSARVKRCVYLHTFVAMSCIIGDVIVIVAQRHRYRNREPQLRGVCGPREISIHEQSPGTQLYGEDLLQLDRTSSCSARKLKIIKNRRDLRLLKKCGTFGVSQDLREFIYNTKFLILRI